MDALRAEHNVDCSTATLSTVLFTDGEPTQLGIGVHGCNNHRKNEFYHTIDLTQTILPVAMDLLPMLHTGLKELYQDYTPESCVFSAESHAGGTKPHRRHRINQ